MSSDPGQDFLTFFNRMGAIKSMDDFNTFMAQYWYAWLIVGLLIIGIVAINIALIYYFRKRKKNKGKVNPLDPMAQNENNEETAHKRTILVPQVLNKNGVPMGAPGGAQSTSQFTMEALIAHNKMRAQHGVPALQYNDNLSKIAQTWADTLAKTQQMQHSPENWRRYNGVVLGENLAYLYGQQLTGTKMTEMWYMEEPKHDYSYDQQPDSQHFSQLVWKGTREVGFGKAKALNGNWFYGVAVYLPAGNLAGQYRANVFPPVM